jgi:hypothetical protein
MDPTSFLVFHPLRVSSLFSLSGDASRRKQRIPGESLTPVLTGLIAVVCQLPLQPFTTTLTFLINLIVCVFQATAKMGKEAAMRLRGYFRSAELEAT